MYQPKHLTLYKRPDSYIGATWYGYYPVAGRSRDSSAVEESNFAVFLRELQPLDTWIEAAPDDPNGDEGEIQTVVVARCSHFLVGWVETIYVHSSNEAAVRVADGLRGRLEDYPLLDEDDVINREWDAATGYWERASVRDRVEAIIRSHASVSIFAARRAEFPSGDDNGALFDYCRE